MSTEASETDGAAVKARKKPTPCGFIGIKDWSLLPESQRLNDTLDVLRQTHLGIRAENVSKQITVNPGVVREILKSNRCAKTGPEVRNWGSSRLQRIELALTEPIDASTYLTFSGRPKPDLEHLSHGVTTTPATSPVVPAMQRDEFALDPTKVPPEVIQQAELAGLLVSTETVPVGPLGK